MLISSNGIKMNENLENLCRLCLQSSLEMDDIFTAAPNYIKIAEELTGIKIQNNFVECPKKICHECRTLMKSFCDFRKRCLESDEWLSKRKQLTMLKEFSSSSSTADVNVIEQNLNNSSNYEEFLSEKTESSEEEKSIPDALKENYITVIENKGIIMVKVENKKMKTVDKNVQPQLNETNMRHEKATKAIDKIICHICGKFYVNKKGSEEYHMNMHTGARPYACKFPGCDRNFARNFLLKRHFRSCHTDYKPFKCEVCDRKFKGRMNLFWHRTIHFDPQLPCNVCDKLFKNTKTLKRHMMIHTNERPFQCEICSKGFRTKYTLNVHQRVHTKEKPYQCERCHKSFAYKGVLKAHAVKYCEEKQLSTAT